MTPSKATSVVESLTKHTKTPGCSGPISGDALDALIEAEMGDPELYGKYIHEQFRTGYVSALEWVRDRIDFLQLDNAEQPTEE